MESRGSATVDMATQFFAEPLGSSGVLDATVGRRGLPPKPKELTQEQKDEQAFAKRLKKWQGEANREIDASKSLLTQARTVEKDHVQSLAKDVQKALKVLETQKEKVATSGLNFKSEDAAEVMEKSERILVGFKQGHKRDLAKLLA
jgi:hypothetical protein